MGRKYMVRAQLRELLEATGHTDILRYYYAISVPSAAKELGLEKWEVTGAEGSWDTYGGPIVGVLKARSKYTDWASNFGEEYACIWEDGTVGIRQGHEGGECWASSISWIDIYEEEKACMAEEC